MKRKLRILYLVLIFLVISIFGVGYAYDKDSVNVWNIHFSNLNVTKGSVAGHTSFNNNDIALSFYAPLRVPGDYYEFSVDVLNNGSSDVIIDNFSLTKLTSKQERYLEYIVTYKDGTTIHKNDILKSRESKSIIVRVEYKKDITASDLPTEDENVYFKVNLNYVEK